MAALSKEIKLFILDAFAAMESPTMIAKMVKAEFGVDMNRAQVAYYNAAEGFASRERMDKELVVYFDFARKRFLEDADRIPINNKNWRQSVRYRMILAEEASRNPNKILIVDLLTEGAKEAGNAYTNIKVLKGDPDEPVEFTVKMGHEITKEKDE